MTVENFKLLCILTISTPIPGVTMLPDLDLQNDVTGNSLRTFDRNRKILRLKEGDNKVRFFSKRVSSVRIHWAKGISVRCPGPGCPLCIDGDIPKAKYFMKVLDRTSEEIKILDFGSTILEQLKDLAMDYAADYSDSQRLFTDIDVLIRRKDRGGRPIYILKPIIVKGPVTDYERTKRADEMALIESDTIDLGDAVRPWTPNQIREFLGR
jgi:hypothetical protein